MALSKLFFKKESLAIKISALIFMLFAVVSVFSQSSDVSPGWDNELYFGNKISIGKTDWRYSGELQFRLKDNTQALDYYFVEGVVSYLPSKKWEITPDLRISVKPNEVEFRPGLGVFNKQLYNKFQLVNQVKWQLDLDTEGNVDNGLRYAIFMNYLIDDKFIPNFVGGVFYRWADNFQGVQFVRFGPGLAFVIDSKHVINLNYLFGVKNSGQEMHWSGIIAIQLAFNLNKEYKYLPAKYISF